MFKITVPDGRNVQVQYRLVGIISIRIFSKIADRLNIEVPEAILTVQRRTADIMPSLKALNTTLLDSNRFLFLALKEDNPNVLDVSATVNEVNEFLKEFPEITPPEVNSEAELFNHIVPDYVTIH